MAEEAMDLARLHRWTKAQLACRLRSNPSRQEHRFLARCYLKVQEDQDYLLDVEDRERGDPSLSGHRSGP